MHRDAETILQAALALSESERLALVDQLLKSLPEQAIAVFEDAKFREEVERRAAEPGETIPWSQIRDEL